MLEFLIGISTVLHVGHVLKVPEGLEWIAEQFGLLTAEECEEAEAIEAVELEASDSLKEIL
ncbi:MAG: hypothetical protein ACLP5H_30385 [Desulfomonilaceae bacterium]